MNCLPIKKIAILHTYGRQRIGEVNKRNYAKNIIERSKNAGITN